MVKILLVDDAAYMRKLVKDILMQNGYTEFFEASDGDEGAEMYARLHPDLVILDINMPRVNGLESLRRIREENKDANVIMCSVMGQQAMVVDAVRLGARDFVVKPFKPERLVKTVAGVIGTP